MAEINFDIAEMDQATFLEEGFLVEVETTINRILQYKNIKKSELAELMEVSPARVSQLLAAGNSQNMTLRTAGKIFAALQEEVTLTSESIVALNEAVEERVRSKAQIKKQRDTRRIWNVESCYNSGESIDEISQSAVKGLSVVQNFQPHASHRKMKFAC